MCGYRSQGISTQLSSTLNASAISKIEKKSGLTLDFQEFSVIVAILALVYLQQTINDQPISQKQTIRGLVAATM
jgi:hypothetical protein